MNDRFIVEGIGEENDFEAAHQDEEAAFKEAAERSSRGDGGFLAVYDIEDEGLVAIFHKGTQFVPNYSWGL